MNTDNIRILEEWSDYVANELATRKFFNIEECKVFAKSIMKVCIEKIIENQASDLKEERAKLVLMKHEKGHTPDVDAKLTKVNSDIKKRNRVMTDFDMENKFMILQKHVIDNFGQQSLRDFYINTLGVPAEKLKY